MKGQIKYKLSEILPLVQKPARYTDHEWNASIKDISQVNIKFALAFPEVYELGMSHLGSRIMYGRLNACKDIAAERVFAPWPDMEEKMREKEIPLFSLESCYPLNKFDLVGFSFQYELTYTNVLNMLDLAGIPLTAEERRIEDPFILAGGPGVFNPEPMAPFIDFFVIGDGEEIIVEIMEKYRQWKKEGGEKRKAFLKMIASLRGVYVPSFYQDYYDGEGRFLKILPREEGVPSIVEKAVLEDLDQAYYPVEDWIVPYLDIVHDRAALEIFRGCTRGCRFCQAGILYRPVRERNPEELKEMAQKMVENTGYEEISLASLSSSDYSRIKTLIRDLQEVLEDKGVRVTLPSLRVDSFSVKLAKIMEKQKKSGLTFAPEGGTQRLRDVINKNVKEEEYLAALEEAFREGWDQVKLYFMIGLPSEEEGDLEGIGALANQTVKKFKEIVTDKKRQGRLKITISTSTFVPKPHTPFQWEAQISLEEMKKRQRFLKEKLRGKHLIYNWHNPETSFLEGVLSRGDRRVSRAIKRAWEGGCRFDSWEEHLKFETWREAFSLAGLNPEDFANRKRGLEENLPWDHISTGVTKKYLIKEYKKSLAGRTTPDCREGRCLGCGVCEPCQRPGKEGLDVREV
ncbi:MAG: TIGR03960 family B12-binding radical SAM protein [Candidatus Syntrophonatronum acetioxidans]|uniref:TIGR03960 family B12-binding radical SAM protein n=1 Tax=Candidatus Syntrophonatronum acetioxidans TaxID=1795816 RepID=A0A424YIJ8_9FIRM|nr:MAG: TIGR03960 family B12-binding radical SAM protein [Candidatus Syntrophonatronum acetioxidans]